MFKYVYGIYVFCQHFGGKLNNQIKYKVFRMKTLYLHYTNLNEDMVLLSQVK